MWHHVATCPEEVEGTERRRSGEGTHRGETGEGAREGIGGRGRGVVGRKGRTGRHCGTRNQRPTRRVRARTSVTTMHGRFAWRESPSPVVGAMGVGGRGQLVEGNVFALGCTSALGALSFPRVGAGNKLFSPQCLQPCRMVPIRGGELSIARPAGCKGATSLTDSNQRAAGPRSGRSSARRPETLRGHTGRAVQSSSSTPINGVLQALRSAAAHIALVSLGLRWMQTSPCSSNQPSQPCARDPSCSLLSSHTLRALSLPLTSASIPLS